MFEQPVKILDFVVDTFTSSFWSSQNTIILNSCRLSPSTVPPSLHATETMYPFPLSEQMFNQLTSGKGESTLLIPQVNILVMDVLKLHTAQNTQLSIRNILLLYLTSHTTSLACACWRNRSPVIWERLQEDEKTYFRQHLRLLLVNSSDWLYVV